MKQQLLISKKDIEKDVGILSTKVSKRMSTPISKGGVEKDDEKHLENAVDKHLGNSVEKKDPVEKDVQKDFNIMTKRMTVKIPKGSHKIYRKECGNECRKGCREGCRHGYIKQ